MSLLRTLIEQAVVEAAISYGQAVSEDLILFDVDQGDGFSYVLVSGKKLLESIPIIKERAYAMGEEKNIKPTAKQILLDEGYFVNHCIVGVLDVATTGKGHSLYTVAAVGAEKGYGPLLYDLAMKIIYPSWLTSDRTGQVKDAAKSVWAYYDTNRPDVQKKDLEGPQRVAKFDKQGLGYLNKAFRQKGDFMKLFDNREKVIKQFIKAKIDRDYLTSIVAWGASAYFDKVYNG
jgi:hypothetical protein